MRLHTSFVLLITGLSLTLLLCCQQKAPAQSQLPDESNEGFVIVRHLTIEGNKRTRANIIMRELMFAPGDTIPVGQLMTRILQSEQNIMNTLLFNDAIIKVAGWEDEYVDFKIIVTERWYIIPVPVWQLADRNFNVWWVEKGHKLSRTVYGLRLLHENFRGRGEKLYITGTLGYTHTLIVNYIIPYINRQQKIGMVFNLQLDRNKEVAYTTWHNKQQFYLGDKYMRWSFIAEGGLTHRKAIHNTHTLLFGYHHHFIDDSVRILNPDYLLDNRFLQRFFKITYIFESDHRDSKSYPLKGYYFLAQAEKSGIGIFKETDMYAFFGTATGFLDLGKNFYLAGQLRGKISFPVRQPYNLQQSLGFLRDLVRGYEYYVMDGRMFGLAKLNLKYRLFSITIDNSRWLKYEQINRIPLAVYLKTYADAGYVKDDFFFHENPLNNTWLVGGGGGIDISTYYNLTIRLEYSVNRLKENALYLHLILDM